MRICYSKWYENDTVEVWRIKTPVRELCRHTLIGRYYARMSLPRILKKKTKCKSYVYLTQTVVSTT